MGKSSEKIQVLLLDHHPIVEHGLQALFKSAADIRLVRRVADVESALQCVAENKIDVLLLEIATVPGGDNIKLIKSLLEQQPGLKILIYTGHPEDIYAERCLRAGCHGYVMKKETGENLLNAIRRVHAGKIQVSSGIRDNLIDTMVHSESYRNVEINEKLTNRELEILEMIGRGLMTAEISKQLSISKKTVDAHKQNIRRKLRLPNSARLAVYANFWTSS